MSLSERGRQPSEVVSKKPLTKPDLRNVLDAQMRVDAKKLLENEAFRQKLSGENLEKFTKDHSKDDYTDYKKWNKDFLEQVMGLKDLTPVQERIHILALQELLNKEKGGFSDKQGKVDSLDGKLGKYTLSKMAEYLGKQNELNKSDDKKEDKPVIPQPDQQTEKRTPNPIVNQNSDALGKLAEKERYQPKNVYYAGDSYMNGTLSGKKIDKNNRSAADSSHFVKTPGFDNEKYRKTHIFIEEEAYKFINNPNCKLLVLNGGINDLYARGHSEKVINEIISTYKKIIDKAHEKGIKVVIYNLNGDVAPKGKSQKTIEGVKSAAQKINNWLSRESGAYRVLDTTKIVAGRLDKGGLHPTAVAYRDLFEKLTDLI